MDTAARGSSAPATHVAGCTGELQTDPSAGTGGACPAKESAVFFAGYRPMRSLFGQASVTGILPILACHSLGPVSCTEVPFESTATVTGMSVMSNS